MKFPNRASVLLLGLASCVLAAGSCGRGPQKVQEDLAPDEGLDHRPIHVWHGDSIEFRCTGCPEGSSYRIVSIELLRDKISRRLGEIEGTEEVQQLVRYLPPEPGDDVPVSPFPGFKLPTDLHEMGASIETTPLPELFKKLKSTQIYAVTWELVDQDGVVTEYDPHIYAQPHSP